MRIENMEFLSNCLSISAAGKWGEELQTVRIFRPSPAALYIHIETIEMRAYGHLANRGGQVEEKSETFHLTPLFHHKNKNT